MIVLGIDPAPEKSWWLKWDMEKQRTEPFNIQRGIYFNARNWRGTTIWSGVDIAVIEDIECFGMPVGRNVFETAKTIGRFLAKAENMQVPIIQMSRREIKLHFCNSARAKDGNIRQAIIDRFGGKEKAIGNKKKPGVFYGVKKDWWSALALCLWYKDTHRI